MTNERLFKTDIVLAFVPEYIGVDISYNTHITIAAFSPSKN